MTSNTGTIAKVTSIRSAKPISSQSQVCKMLSNFLEEEKSKLEVHPRHCQYWQDLWQLTTTLTTTDQEKERLEGLQPADPFIDPPATPEDTSIVAEAQPARPEDVAKSTDNISYKDDGSPESVTAKDKKARKAQKKAKKEAKRARKEAKKRERET